jgi:hypothetical protein
VAPIGEIRCVREGAPPGPLHRDSAGGASVFKIMGPIWDDHGLRRAYGGVRRRNVGIETNEKPQLSELRS